MLVSVNQNDKTRKISTWAAILIVPDDHPWRLPDEIQIYASAGQKFSYAFTLKLIALISVRLYLRFKG